MSPFSKPIITSRNMNDITVPGVAVEVDQAEAARLGAFEEDAITEQEAHESTESLA